MIPVIKGGEIMDFDKIFALNKFFENETKTEVQKDLDALRHGFFNLDSSFDRLLSNYLLIPLTESESDIEDDRQSVRESYEAFFEDFKRTANLLVELYKKYRTTKDFKDNGLSKAIENKFQNAKISYDMVMNKANEITNPNYEKLVKHLEDAYFAYVYLLRGFNSLIDAYNIQHPQALLRRIENVPAPPDLGVFKDEETTRFVKSFVSSLSELVID